MLQWRGPGWTTVQCWGSRIASQKASASGVVLGCTYIRRWVPMRMTDANTCGDMPYAASPLTTFSSHER